MGWKIYMGEKMAAEFSYGVGMLFFTRKYDFFINTQTSNRGLGHIFNGPYDDRNIGRTEAVNLLCQLKLSYQIFSFDWVPYRLRLFQKWVGHSILR